MAEKTFAGLSDSPVLQYSVIAEGDGHDEDCRFFRVMMNWVYNKTVKTIEDYPPCKK